MIRLATKISISIFIISFIFLSSLFGQSKIDKEDYKRFINNHQYNSYKKLTPKELKQIPKKDRPDLGWQQNFIKTMDPSLGYPPDERMIEAYKYTDSLLKIHGPGRSAIPNVSWQERGPDNIGGRTRALMFDPNDTTKKKVWAGGVTGGLWYNNDITSSTSSWVKVNDFWDNIAVSCITYDTNNKKIFYVGTGEGFTAGSSSTSRGAGIWKSTDGGLNWVQLSSTKNYFYINDIAVRNEAGNSVLYAAVDMRYYQGTYHGSPGLFRSTNGGTSFTQVAPNINGFPYAPADIEIGADNRIYIGTRSNSFGKGAGTILYSDNGTTWTTVSRFSSMSKVGRVELACAPSNANYVYALIEINQKAGIVAYSKNKGVSWTIVNKPNDADPGIDSSDFTRNQAWYDLILAVDPNDYQTIIAGGIDLHISNNSGINWTQLSHWYGGYGYPFVHADHHAIIFKPGSSSVIINGNDGGVFYSSNMKASTPFFYSRNRGYNVTQFYSCALNPNSGSNNFIGGTQDNGTLKFSTSGMNSVVDVTGGDGCFSFIDQDDGNIQISSYVYNNYYLTKNNWTTYTQISSDNNTGEFINIADYDSKEDILYSARTNNSIQRIRNISTTPAIPDTIGYAFGSMISAIIASPYSGTGSSTIFVGTEAGDLFKIENAHSTSIKPTISKITGSNFPSGNISSIDIGKSENELLITFSNYGISSVFESLDGGLIWKDKEGNLPDMPIRWAIYNPDNTKWVLLATEIGVWSTTDIKAAVPVWGPTNGGLSHVRTDMLQYRPSDKKVLAATHGRGMFSFYFTSIASLTAKFDADIVCLGDSTTLTNTSISTFSIDSVMWDLDSNGLFNDAKGDVIKTRFGNPDTFWVGIKVFSSGSIDSFYKQIYIKDNPIADFSLNDSTPCLNDTVFFTNKSTNGSGLNMTYYWSFNDGSNSTLTNPFHYYTFPNFYDVKLVTTASNTCSDSVSKKVKVVSKTIASFSINDTIQCLEGNYFIFTNQSLSCDTLISVKWDLDGDGLFNNDSGSVVSNNYLSSDTILIGLKVMTAYSSDSHYRKIIILNKPIAGFNVNSSTQFLTGNNFVFTNTTKYNAVSNPSGFTYKWFFGDGDSASSMNTQHSYLSIGNFNVKMMAFSPKMCSDTITKTVSVIVQGVVADFQTDSSCVGDTLVLINKSASMDPILGYSWALDNDSVFNDNINDSIISYYNPNVGRFKVGLKVWTAFDTNEIFKEVELYPIPIASFSVNQLSQPVTTNNFILTNNSNISNGSMNYIWDFGDGSTSSSLNPTHHYNDTGNFKILLTATSLFGCWDSFSIYVNVDQQAIAIVNADFTASDACVGKPVMINEKSTVQGGVLSVLFWDYGDGYDAILKGDHEYTYYNSGVYKIRMIAMANTGARDTIIKSINVYPTPMFSLNFDGDTVLFEGGKVGVAVNGLFDSIFWSTGENSLQISVSDSGAYWVRIVDQNQCDATKYFNVIVKQKERWTVTEAFTPNSDGVNDLWQIENIDDFKPIDLTIFNRWGDVLYEKNDYQNDWNGKNLNGVQLPEGTYYYIVRTKDGSVYKGTLNIIY